MARKRKPRKLVLKGVPKECFFCKEKKEPTFEDVGTLQRFLKHRFLVNIIKTLYNKNKTRYDHVSESLPRVLSHLEWGGGTKCSSN